MQKAHRDVQRLERMVSDLRLKLGAYEHEEASSRMGFQPGSRARGYSDGEAGTQRDGAGQRQPVHVQNGGGDPARMEEQRYDELSTMS